MTLLAWAACHASTEREWVSIEVTVGGESRSAWVSAPPEGGPAVLVLHAGRGSGAGAAATRFGPAFAESGSIAVFPDAAPVAGMSAAWGGPDHGPDPLRDVHFIEALRVEVERRWEVSGWSVAGASSGAYLTWVLLCSGGPTFDRALIVSRGLPAKVAENCRFDRRVTVRWVGAAADPGLADPRQRSIPETRAFLDANAAAMEFEVVPGALHAWALPAATDALADLARAPAR